MAIITFLLTIFFAIVVFHQVLYWVYLWQLKEYRLDRFLAGLRTRNDFQRVLVDQFNLARWYRPKRTVREMLVSVVSLVVLGFLVGEINILIQFLVVLFAPVFVGMVVAIFTPVFVLVKKVIVVRATQKMKKFKGTVIGITGSFGKSSTKEMLATVLGSPGLSSGQARFTVVKTEGNDNSEIGVAQTVLKKLKGNEDFFVVEMGAYKIGEIAAICRMVRPKIGIITGIGDQHLDLFGSLENIKKAKYELIEAIPVRGLRLVADKDFKLAEAQKVKQFPDHVEFVFGGQKFSVRVLGKELVRNVLAVIKTARFLGLTLSLIATVLEDFDGGDTYPRLYKGSFGGFVVDNSYNSSVDSFISALGYLSVWRDFKKVVVTAGMLELGQRAHVDHLAVGRALSVADVVLVTSANYFSELNELGGAELLTDRKKLENRLDTLADKKTVVLFQGRIPKVVFDSLLY